ncbi:MAG: 50S ribosomal protein L11 methyltransferase [Clostridia bacterium]|nr:50S ribosomal protein L11 methyltransferase [Clostridia bacterium]
MQWTELTVKVNHKDTDVASDILSFAAEGGIYVEDYSSLEDDVFEVIPWGMIDEELLEKNREEVLIHIYIKPESNPVEVKAFIDERLNTAGISHETELVLKEEDEWLNNWRQYYQPMEVGENLLIQPVFRDEVKDTDRTVIKIEPGLAFGTGNHESTRLCLESVEKYTEKGMRVLDVGCGSGILGIASVLLGAEEAYGVDIDETAVRIANENAELNEVVGRFTAECGDLTEHAKGKFNLVLANIVADVIISLTENIKTYMAEDATFVMSGIIDTREEDVLAALNKNGFDIMERKPENGWVCLVAKSR